MPACSGVLWRFEKRKPPFEIGGRHLGRLQRSAVVSSQQFLLELNSPHLSKIACGTPFLEHAVADREERGAPRNKPIRPNAIAPPSTPNITRISGVVPPPRLIRNGLTRLSRLPTINAHTRMNTAHAVETCRYSQKTAGAATSIGPPGITATMNVRKPSAAGPGTPATMNPIAASTPWTSAVPRTP